MISGGWGIVSLAVVLFFHDEAIRNFSNMTLLDKVLLY